MNATGPSQPPDSPPRHSVQVVARDTGLTPDTLRMWERRYGVVVPGRSEGRHRLYTDAEVERLRLLAELVRGGRRIKDVAGLDGDQLAQLLRRDAAIAPRAAQEAEPVEACLRAIAALDDASLDAALARAASSLGAATFVENTIPAVLREIGARWEHGTMSVAHEHLATVRVRWQLVRLLEQQQPPPGAPLLLVTTPAGERHELGALSASVVAAAVGWRAVFLGASVPARDIATAARQLGASAIALSLLHPEADADIDGEMSALMSALGRGIPVLVGGARALERRAELEGAGARVLADLADLRHELLPVPLRARG